MIALRVLAVPEREFRFAELLPRPEGEEMRGDPLEFEFEFEFEFELELD